AATRCCASIPASSPDRSSPKGSRWSPAPHARRESTRGAVERDAGRALSPPSVHAALVSLPVRLAELELLELAGRGPRQLAPDLDRRRALEVGHARPAEVDQLLFRRRGAGLQHDQRLDRLAPLL